MEGMRGTAIITGLSTTDELKNVIFKINRTSIPAGYFVRESHKDCGVVTLFDLKTPERTFKTFVDDGRVYVGKEASNIITEILLAQGICFRVEEDSFIPQKIRSCLSTGEN